MAAFVGSVRGFWENSQGEVSGVWVAIKELKLSYYIGETLYILLYIPIMGTLFYVP